MTPTHPSIRPATAADAPVLARLRYTFRSAIDPTNESESDFMARCTNWMATRLQDGRWRCWIAEEAGEFLGTVWLNFIEKLPNPVAEPESHAYISSLYVDPTRRSQGIGGLLLAEALRESDARGVDAAILWPTPRSRTLYQRHGFEVRDDLFERRLGPIMPHARQI